MGSTARWRNWRPSGLHAAEAVIPAAKPTKLLADAEHSTAAAAQLETSGCVDLGAAITALASIGLAAKPSKPSKLIQLEGPDGFAVNTKSAIVLEAEFHQNGLLLLRQQPESRGPEPTGIRTVPVPFDKNGARLTVARHHLACANRFGQDGTEFQFCLVNLPAWRKMPFNLRAARWYRSQQEAVEQVIPPLRPLPSPPPEASLYRASFGGGVEVELRRENGSRWHIWVNQGGRLIRRKDFTTLYLDHARRTAEHWYGPAIDAWHAPKGEGK